jgi:hypothetical protein
LPKAVLAVTDEIKAQYVELVRSTGLLCMSAAQLGLSFRTIDKHRRMDPEFAEDIKEAVAQYADEFEGKVLRVADPDRGWDEPVYQKGECVGYVRRFSERMMELVLKRHKPEYRDKLSIDATVKGGVLLVAATAASPEEWRKKFCPPQIEGAASPSPETAGSA